MRPIAPIGLLILGTIGLLFCCMDAVASDVPCAACHGAAAKALGDMPHGKLPDASRPQCTSCHGDGQAHLAAPGASTILDFATAPATEQNAACASCHEQAHPAESNAHTVAGVACTSCHGVHAKKKDLAPPGQYVALKSGSSQCYSCHVETFAEFNHNERHRLFEGALECSSCHDPHNPSSGLRLGGFKQSMCSNCHANVAGPFVFEHAASRVEGCTACHSPHGSPNRHLLNHQDVGALCYSCHADAPQFHLGFSPVGGPRFDQKTVCTNCHVAVHGSNVDRALLR